MPERTPSQTVGPYLHIGLTQGEYGAREIFSATVAELQAVFPIQRSVRVTLTSFLRRQLREERFLVPEVMVNGGGCIADAVGDRAHRRGLVAVLDEHLPRGVQDGATHLGPLALAAL